MVRSDREPSPGGIRWRQQQPCVGQPWPVDTWGSVICESEHGRVYLNLHAPRSKGSAPAMTPSGLISAATFLIVIPTALIIRLLTLLNLNAVVLYSSHENRPLAPSDTNPTLNSDLMEQPADSLPSWLTHVLQNHNLSRSTSQWKGLDVSVVVSVHLTVDFAQPSANDLFDTVTINAAGEKGRPHAISPSSTTAHLHGNINSDGREDYEPQEEMRFQSVGFTNLLVHPLGLVLVCFAAWRQASRLRSLYHSFLLMTRNARATASFRKRECTEDREDAQVPSYENILSKGG